MKMVPANEVSLDSAVYKKDKNAPGWAGPDFEKKEKRPMDLK